MPPLGGIFYAQNSLKAQFISSSFSTSEVRVLLRNVFIIVSLSMLTACSSTIESYKQTLKSAFVPAADVELDLVTLQQNPGSFLYLRPNDRGRAALALISSQSGIAQWYSADNRIVELNQGRLSKLQGFKPNLDFVAFSTPDPISLPLDKIRAGLTARSVNDWSYSQLTSYTVAHEVIDKSSTSLTFFDRSFPMVLVQEKVTFPDGSTFINQFWFDANSGQLVKSIQKPSHFSAQFELIEISKIAQQIQVTSTAGPQA